MKRHSRITLKNGTPEGSSMWVTMEKTTFGNIWISIESGRVIGLVKLVWTKEKKHEAIKQASELAVRILQNR